MLGYMKKLITSLAMVLLGVTACNSNSNVTPNAPVASPVPVSTPSASPSTDVGSAGPGATQWENYKHKFNKSYSAKEDSRRKEIFTRNLANINQMNQEHGNSFGLTRFTDMDAKEFKQYLTYQKSGMHSQALKHHKPHPKPTVTPSPVVQVDSFDWRTKGAVSPVKNQGQCGSCWAFSVAETLESGSFLKTGKMPLLSPQQMVDCDNQDYGCQGGEPSIAYEYVMKNGLESEASYPYTSSYGQEGYCQYNSSQVAAKISGYHYAVSECSSYDCSTQATLEPELKTALQEKGPLSVCLNASAWQNYTGGILTSNACGGNSESDLDHCVQLVGFNKDSNGNAYWILRNQWGTDWGDNGYIYLEMGKNTCGMVDEATYVDIE